MTDKRYTLLGVPVEKWSAGRNRSHKARGMPAGHEWAATAAAGPNHGIDARQAQDVDFWREGRAETAEDQAARW